jgi:hypothetical protein
VQISRSCSCERVGHDLEARALKVVATLVIVERITSTASTTHGAFRPESCASCSRARVAVPIGNRMRAECGPRDAGRDESWSPARRDPPEPLAGSRPTDKPSLSGEPTSGFEPLTRHYEQTPGVARAAAPASRPLARSQ